MSLSERHLEGAFLGIRATKRRMTLFELKRSLPAKYLGAGGAFCSLFIRRGVQVRHLRGSLSQLYSIATISIGAFLHAGRVTVVTTGPSAARL